MSTENTSNQEEKEQTTEQHDCHCQTGNMSGETTSNRKKSKRPLTNMITSWQMLQKRLNVKEKKKHLNNVIVAVQKREETPDQRDHHIETTQATRS